MGKIPILWGGMPLHPQLAPSTAARRSLSVLLPPVALLIAAPGLARGADEPPTVPAGLVANIYSATAGGIGWQRSSDDRFVRGYEVARDGDVLGVFDALSYIEDSLAPATAYRYTVTAIDSAGQRSDAAAVTLVTAGGAPPAADGTATVDEGSLTAGLRRRLHARRHGERGGGRCRSTSSATEPSCPSSTTTASKCPTTSEGRAGYRNDKGLVSLTRGAVVAGYRGIEHATERLGARRVGQQGDAQR